ncbi:MAG: hypothetical protein AAF192_08650 [Pseudomonadota bacterium]
MASIPYASAAAGDAAIAETRELLYRHGADSFGVMERNDASGRVLMLQFEHRGRQVTLKVAMAGYAAWWLRENPWTRRRKATEQEWQEKAREAARSAAPSILRDYVKAALTMVEAGAMTFEGAFLGGLHLPNGSTVYDALTGPDGPLSLPPPADAE